jgi:carboxypeptidase Taq
MNPQEAYNELVERAKELFTIGTINALVGWDQRVNMPPAGIRQRSQMAAYLQEIAHRKQSDPRIGELLATAEQGQWEPGAAANLREWRRDYDQATKLPPALVRRRAELTAQANNVWQESRASSDFSKFAPYLRELVGLSREIADHLGYEGERYDALLDLYEPGLTTVEVDAFFAELRRHVVPLLEKILASPVKADRGLFRNAEFPAAAQQALGIAVTKALGFDYEAGRLDVSTHPFTTSFGRSDVRLTTRYDLAWPFQSLMGTIHEAGHGMYDQGLPEEHEGTPLGETVSLGIHESQSRFWENNIGRSRGFWQYWYPRFKAEFPGQVGHLTLDQLFCLVNDVRPTLIRVEADEVTYNLHILVRFELERDLFRDALQPADLPAAWNEKYQRYLGITPATEREGVLQDVHWSWAYFGYFPTYSLGTVYAAQLEAALRCAVPELDWQMAAGNFSQAFQWMRENIHRFGKLYRPKELIEKATGQPPAAADYVAYLTRKYSEIYRL